jgi:hypothetical protein
MTEWIDQEQTFVHKVRKEIYDNNKRFELYDDMMNYLVKNNFAKSKKELIEIFKDKTRLLSFVSNLNFQFLSVIAERENLSLYNKHIDTSIQEKKVLKYIKEKNLKLSCAIKIPKKIIKHESETIQAMHSVGKIVTGFLIHLFARLKIIPITAFNEPLQLDDTTKLRLSPKILARLKSTTMLDVMTHKSGLGDYIENYIKDVDRCIKNNLDIPNPQEPEDFLCWGDTSLKQKGDENYSNFGILLCGLSVKYHYNKNKPREQHLTYNQILQKYIIQPAKLKTFMIKYKQIKNIKVNRDDKNNTKYLNGSPAGGYWISTNELMKLGNAIGNAYIGDKQLMVILKKFGGEFYDKKNNIISHYGSLAYSTAYLEIDLSNGSIVAIMSNHYNDTDILSYALHLFK